MVRTMATQHTETASGPPGIRGRLYQYRSAIAALLAVGLTGGLLVWLESLSVPLAESTTMRDGSIGLVGGEMVYNAYDGLWLGLRAALGLYIVFVAILISLFVLTSWKEIRDDHAVGGD